MQFSGLCLLRKPDIANFVLKSANFCYHGNKGRSEQSLTDNIKLRDPYNSYWMQVSRQYLLHQLSYSLFSVEIRKFTLLWQQGWLYTKFDSQHEIVQPI